MAYKVAIIPASCVDCSRAATCIVKNNRNEEIGPRCTRCGDALVESMNAEGR